MTLPEMQAIVDEDRGSRPRQWGLCRETQGIRVLGQTEVIDLDVAAGRVRAVLTNHPEHVRLDCDHVVIATNNLGLAQSANPFLAPLPVS